MTLNYTQLLPCHSVAVSTVFKNELLTCNCVFNTMTYVSAAISWKPVSSEYVRDSTTRSSIIGGSCRLLQRCIQEAKDARDNLRWNIELRWPCYWNRLCNFHIWSLHPILRLLTHDNMVAYNIVHSRLDYCNSLPHEASEKSLDRLQQI